MKGYQSTEPTTYQSVFNVTFGGAKYRVFATCDHANKTVDFIDSVVTEIFGVETDILSVLCVDQLQTIQSKVHNNLNWKS